ncbi:PREDICTED: basement membrane-specific heparan sulfate proteoglycan core protein-like [Branchiostoma belcheri]|uniref:Basement membrane-specific heparan sulfate proteoglycan core protein-like n=1 Tax=Branchiostoma belcheri TaxID=7741 RepID=A0A6P4YGJ2_BRABE|nr:PREDICTED: basement membrane-specific heparan sulfate proteoglycan core protein-like [Branchiostoma belcheri]
MWTLLIALSVYPVTRADVTVTVTAPQGVQVGQQAIISCVIDPDQQAAVTWTKGGPPAADGSTTVLVHNQGISDGRYNEYSDRDIDIEGRASLRIQTTRLSDRGEFFCAVFVIQAGQPVQLPPQSAVLSVSAPTGSPTISPPGTPSTESPLTLTCTTAGGYPPATISWYRGQEDRTAEAEQQTDVEQSDGSVTSSRQYIFTPTKDDSGVSYRCVVSQTVLQSNLEAQTTFNVRYPAEISPTPPATTTVIAGQSALFSCPADGNPDTFIFTWKEGGRTINTDAEDQFSQNGGVLTISAVRRNQHDTVFLCDVTNNIGSADTASTTLDVQYPPDVSAPVTVTVEENHDLVAECTVTANPAVTSVEWKKQGSTSAVSNSATLSITRIQRGAAGTYVCTARNMLHDDSIGTGTASTVVIVQYAPSKPSLTIAPSPVVENQTVTLTCRSTSAVPDPTYTWKFTAQGQSEQDVDFGTTADSGGTLTITNVQRARAGQYRCTATNVVGSTDSDATELVVNFPPEGVSITPEPQEVELGDNITLDCSVTAANPAVQEYSWSKSVGSLPAGAQGSTTNQLQITGLTRQDSGTYICTASNGLSSSGNATYPLFVQYLDQPTITSNPGGSGQTSHTTTEGQSLSLECTAQSYPNATVVWTRPDGTTQEGSVLNLGQVNRTEAGTYNCTASNTIKGTQRSNHASLVIILNYPPSVVSFKADPNPVDENSPVTLNCTVDSNPEPTSVSIVRVGAGSVGYVTQATGQGGTFSHTLQTVSYTDTGTYRCQAANGVGEAASRDLELLVNYIPVFVGVRDKYAAAKGDPVTLTCNVTAYPTPVTFSWTKDGGSVPGWATITNYSLGSTLSYTAVTKTDYGFYNCTARNIMGSNSTDIQLAAESAPEPSTDLTVTMKNSSHYVTVEWTAGFNGGRDTTHTVQYRTDAGAWQNGPQELESASDDHPQFSVTFQLPEKEIYDIRVRATNGIEPTASNVPYSNVVSVTIEDAKILFGSLPLTSETFSDELKNLQSTSAVRLTNRIINELNDVFVDILGYETSTVTGYSQGSVVAAFQSIVGESESESAQKAFTDSLTDNQLGSWTVDSSKASIGENPSTGEALNCKIYVQLY